MHELRAASAKREEARRVSDGGARAAESEESDDDMQAPRLVGRSALSPRVSVDKQSAPAQPVPAHQDDVKPALVYRRACQCEILVARYNLCLHNNLPLSNPEQHKIA